MTNMKILVFLYFFSFYLMNKSIPNTYIIWLFIIYIINFNYYIIRELILYEFIVLSIIVGLYIINL